MGKVHIPFDRKYRQGGRPYSQARRTQRTRVVQNGVDSRYLSQASAWAFRNGHIGPWEYTKDRVIDKANGFHKHDRGAFPLLPSSGRKDAWADISSDGSATNFTTGFPCGKERALHPFGVSDDHSNGDNGDQKNLPTTESLCGEKCLVDSWEECHEQDIRNKVDILPIKSGDPSQSSCALFGGNSHGSCGDLCDHVLSPLSGRAVMIGISGTGLDKPTYYGHMELADNDCQALQSVMKTNSHCQVLVNTCGQDELLEANVEIDMHIKAKKHLCERIVALEANVAAYHSRVLALENGCWDQ